MRNFGLYIAVIVVTGLLSACIDDDNNYNYKEINDIDGQILNMPEEKTLALGEEWLITPEFKFTIDSINPDVTYEWYVDKQLQKGENGPTFTFKSDDKNGYMLITFVVKDNKSGIRFSKSTRVFVRSIYLRGWAILSDNNGNSVLNFISPSTLSYTAEYEDEKFTRDSLVYHKVYRDVAPGLGSEPKGLMSHMGLNDYQNLYKMEVYDELLVKQGKDNWVELNGNTLERAVRTIDEFRGDVPENFEPVEAAMTFSLKALLDKSGLIYLGKKGDAADFHANTYVSVGLNNNTKFSRLFESYKVNQYDTDIILALTKEDNTLVGILNNANPSGNASTIPQIQNGSAGKVCKIKDNNGEDHFNSLNKEVVEAFSAPYSENGYGYEESYWTMLLKDKASSSYDLRFFRLAYDKNGNEIVCDEGYFIENHLGIINNLTGFTNFGSKHYVVIADGNQLYYAQYGWDSYTGTEYQAKLIPLGEPFTSPVKKLACHDVNINSNVYMYPYDGQLGVVLEDGSFYIFSVVEEKEEDGTTTAVSLKQQYPNEKTSEQDKNFGKVVDILYKHGRTDDFLNFSF